MNMLGLVARVTIGVAAPMSAPNKPPMTNSIDPICRYGLPRRRRDPDARKVGHTAPQLGQEWVFV